MIKETTWNPNEKKQTRFEWGVSREGLKIKHSSQTPSYIIPWESFSAVQRQLVAMAQSNNPVPAGISMTDPCAGSLGAWVNTQELITSVTELASRHLSFLGPILGRMGLIERSTKGNSILWKVN